MRVTFWGSLVLCLPLILSRPVRADDQAEPKALVDRAIKAAGGEAKLQKLKAMTWKAKCTFTDGNMRVPFTVDGSFQGTTQARLDITAEVENRTIDVGLVLNGDKGWFKGPNQINAIPKEVVAFLRTDLEGLRLAQMLVPLKGKDCKLSALGEVTVNDMPAVGVKATRKGHPDVDIYFDKKTHLPVKCQVTVKEGSGGQETAHEFFLGAPKESEGIRHFTKVTFKRDDKKAIEAELSDLKAVDQLDAETFAKPE